MRATSHSVAHSTAETFGGTPVFCGTQVPVQSLFDYLEGSEVIEHFLDQFPSLLRKHVLAALELARDSVLASAHSA